MTLDQFVEQLSQTKGKWSNEENCLRLTRRGKEHCPLTALAVALGVAEKIDVEDYGDAAKALKIHPKTADKIVSAADNSEGHDVKLRAALMKACRIKVIAGGGGGGGGGGSTPATVKKALAKIKAKAKASKKKAKA